MDIYHTLPLIHMPEGHAMVCFYTDPLSSFKNCLALLPTQHNSTTILLHKTNCLPVTLNIQEDLPFSNHDVAMYKQKMRFCFTTILSLQIKYHTTVCGPGSTPSQKVFLNKPMNFHETLCVYFTQTFS